MRETAFDRSKLPNYLTYGRIAAIPVIMLLIVSGVSWLRWLAFLLYVAAAITDFFDGYLARKYGSVSDIGKMLDPIADKLLVGALLIVFAFDGTFGGWDLIPATVILLREIFVSGLREYMGNKAIAIPVSKLAKYKTTLQLVAIGVLVLEPLVLGMREVSDILLWATAILTAITGWQYWSGMNASLRDRDSEEDLP